MKVKAFVTGGSGFIGSHLVDRLVDTFAVTVYDNFSSGNRDFIKHHLDKQDFQLVQADLLDFSTLKQAIAGHQVVFHLAANPDIRKGIGNTRLDLEQETIATYNILESMRLNCINSVVFTSSSTVYGENAILPFSEHYGPILPISLYGAGKVASEALISAFCQTFDMQAWIFRLANVVGTRANHGALFDFIQKLKKNPSELEILGDGTQFKPYIHVDDCVEGILFGFRNSHNRVNVYNLGCTSVTKVNTIAKMVVEAMGLRTAKLRYSGGDRGWPGDVPKVRFDIEKIKALGWQPKYTSDEAVYQAIKEILEEL